MTPKVGIVLINYKTYAKRFLEDCRDSLRKIDYPKDKYVVYIVDNATTPETETYLREMYPEAVILPNKENSGWGGGNNVGIEQAFKDGCEDIVLSNMDVIVHPDWLRELVAAAYSQDRHPERSEGSPTPPKADAPRAQNVGNADKLRDSSASPQNDRIGIIGMVQSRLFLHPIKSDGIQRLNSLGNALHFLGFGYCNGYGDPVDAHPDTDIKDITYASGASCYVKGEVFKKIGLCNPDFFMYHDDVELCLKARFAGYRIVLAPKSIMWHKYEFGRSILQVYYMERNRLITMLEFYTLPTLLLLAPAFFAMELGVLIGAIVGGYAKPKLRSWGYFFRLGNWQKILRERQRIQARRTMSDRVLMKDFTGRILFQEVMNPVLKYVVNPTFNGYWQVARRVMFW